MITRFSEVEQTNVRSALNVLIDGYVEMAAKEKNDTDRAAFDGIIKVGREILNRFRFSVRPDADTDLGPGEISAIERALRMSAAKCQAMIKPSMPAVQKAFHRSAADEVSALLSRLRKERGLPW